LDGVAADEKRTVRGAEPDIGEAEAVQMTEHVGPEGPESFTTKTSLDPMRSLKLVSYPFWTGKFADADRPATTALPDPSMATAKHSSSAEPPR
jgi:hypothetical protein